VPTTDKVKEKIEQLQIKEDALCNKLTDIKMKIAGATKESHQLQVRSSCYCLICYFNAEAELLSNVYCIEFIRK